jgi:hypothetical protein
MGVRLHGLHRDDFAAKKTKSVDVVDEIDEDRARAFPATPSDVEIAVGLHCPECAVNRDDSPKSAGIDDRLCLPDHRVIPPVMGDQQGRSRLLPGLDKFRCRGNTVGDRLLDNGRHARCDGFEAVPEMELVRVAMTTPSGRPAASSRRNLETMRYSAPRRPPTRREKDPRSRTAPPSAPPRCARRDVCRSIRLRSLRASLGPRSSSLGGEWQGA